ncbi:type VI secretion system lipoprotein TssJ [Marinospirillum minutulum]|uniref:type VI secretion system lipoprotein TssJ n=1 Tax=Marinospirillum minutulum TaxID=64974 RepID=UPI0004888CE2|nr:type VI secretion system lipoprotein TssJ [Marinospirillum minutulum]
MKAHSWLIYLFIALLLGGCAGKPVDEWTGYIEPEYQASDSLSNWEWVTARQQWEYEGKEWTPPHLPVGAASYEPKSIALHLKASNQLNTQAGEARTLVLKLIQMSSPAELDNYRSSSFRLADLMAADSTQLSGDFLRESSVILAPGETKSLALDRVKGASYLVVLAGYFQMTDDASVRLVSIPAVTGRTVSYVNKKRWWWPFAWRPFKGPVTSPAGDAARLKIWLEIGEERIDSLRARAF